ncbi:hypothetical protein ACFL35_14460 [Candidatus Riflebacteria bacterium]
MKWLGISFLVAFLPAAMGYAGIHLTFNFIDLLNQWLSERVNTKD